MSMDQQDRYYQCKAAVQEALGTTLTSDQMNRLFFDVMEPLYSQARLAQMKLEKVQDALITLTSIEKERGS